MKVNRRTTLGILAGAAGGSRIAAAQAPAAAAADHQLQSAREELRDNTKRIAAVSLPRSTEPAFLFRA